MKASANYRLLSVGDPAPDFRQASLSNPDYSFGSTAGRFLVLCFFGSTADELGRDMLRIVEDHRQLFDDSRIAFFGVSADASDARERRIVTAIPGIRHFLDYDHSVGKLYGVAPVDAAHGVFPYRRQWFVLDPNLRIRAVFHAERHDSKREIVAEYLRNLPEVDLFSGFRLQAPVIFLPNVFERSLCDRLISLHDTHGGTDSGFMREIDGKTVAIKDHAHKRRSDYHVEEEAVLADIRRAIARRVVPEIRKVHQFNVTRMERYIVACYDSATGDHFNAHRDNTTKGTAHRRFALSIGLNDEYEGGKLCFPEYGSQSFKLQAGSAVVFSCSLLHAVTPVKAGRRYVFLPFLYDDAAAAQREQNNAFLDQGIGQYAIAPKPV